MRTVQTLSVSIMNFASRNDKKCNVQKIIHKLIVLFKINFWMKINNEIILQGYF